MKSFFKEFFKRGLMSAWGGPLILAIVYYIIGKNGAAESIPIGEVSLGIITITIMAFIAGGITAIYRSERLPVVSAVLIHAAVLYCDYLFMYLLNDWLPKSEIGFFTIIFAAGFAFVWLIIYICIRRKTDDINELRRKKVNFYKIF